MKLTNFLRLVVLVSVIAVLAATVSSGVGAPAASAAIITSLRVAQDGAFAPYGFDFAQPPQVYVRNGKLYQPGAVTAIFPGPAMAPIFESTISNRGLRRITDAARTARLLAAPRDYGHPNVSDLPTTTITIGIGRSTFVHKIYALGFDRDLPDAQRARRAKLSTFLAAVGDANSAVLKGTVGEARQYAGDRIRVLPFPADLASVGDGAAVKPWPLERVQLIADKCIGAEGDIAAALRRTINSGNSTTLWEQSGQTFRLHARRVLPGEALCP